jgi:hypothetical protein
MNWFVAPYAGLRWGSAVRESNNTKFAIYFLDEFKTTSPIYPYEIVSSRKTKRVSSENSKSGILSSPISGPIRAGI